MITSILQLQQNQEYVIAFADNTQISAICSSIDDEYAIFVNYSTGEPIQISPDIMEVCIFEETDDDYTFKYDCILTPTNMYSLVGNILTNVVRVDDAIQFSIKDHEYKIAHEQICCETVYLDDVVGDLKDIEDTIILDAKETISKCGAYFYDIRSIKGSVTLRFMQEYSSMYSSKASIIKI